MKGLRCSCRARQSREQSVYDAATMPCRHRSNTISNSGPRGRRCRGQQIIRTVVECRICDRWIRVGGPQRTSNRHANVNSGAGGDAIRPTATRLGSRASSIYANVKALAVPPPGESRVQPIQYNPKFPVANRYGLRRHASKLVAANKAATAIPVLTLSLFIVFPV